MTEYVTLMGAEDVRAAGRTISGAAETMSQSATNIDGSLERHQRFMDDWLDRFKNVLEEYTAKMAESLITSNLGPIPEIRTDPEAEILVTPEAVRKYITPSPEYPCVDCGKTADPGYSGCGESSCPHHTIPF